MLPMSPPSRESEVELEPNKAQYSPIPISKDNRTSISRERGMGRSPCCPKEGLNRGAWTGHEDKVLKDYIRVHGEGRWRNLPKRAGLKRCGKSCRLRWLNYLRPDIKRGNISSDEEELIIRLHKLLGNRWSLIAGRLPGRTDNEIKNYWNTNLGKKVKDHTNQTSSSSRRRCTRQQDEKSTENPKPQAKVTLTPSPSSPTPPKTDSHVVRTKATKCSKVVLINPPLPPSPMQLQKHSNTMTEPEPEPEPEVVDAEAVANKANESLSNQKEFSVYNSGFLSFLNEQKELISSDLLMDYDIVGDVCLSDLLNSSDFLDMCGLSYSNNNSNDELLSPCLDQPADPVFSDEIFKDWTHTNFAQDSNLSNNLCSFTSVLESSEEGKND